MPSLSVTRVIQAFLTICIGAFLVYKEVNLIINKNNVNIFDLNDPPGYLFRPSWAIGLNLICAVMTIITAGFLCRKNLKPTTAGLLTFISLIVNLAISSWW